MMALAGVELKTLVCEPDALTTRPPISPVRPKSSYKVIVKGH